MRFRHDRERADMRAGHFRIVFVMMVVRTAPDAARTQRIYPENAHEDPGEF